MLKNIKTFLNQDNAAYITIFGYLVFFNIFVLKLTPELLFLQFLIITVAFKRSQKSQFIKDWIIYIALFLLYEFLRGVVDDISPFYNYVLYWAHYAEAIIFPELPTLFLQKYFLNNLPVLYVSFLFYTSFFYYPFVIGYVIWVNKRELFHMYFKHFMIVSYIGLLFYFILPTAPPWFVNNSIELGINRSIFMDSIINTFKGFAFFSYFVNGNPVAAYPSLHTAWTAFTSFFIIEHFGKKYWFTIIVPIMVGFSVVLTGEHYVIDVVAGLLLAYLIVRSTKKFTYNYQ